MQKEREEKLITFFKNQIEPFVEVQPNQFDDWAKSEAHRLSQAGKSRSPFPSL